MDDDELRFLLQLQEEHEKVLKALKLQAVQFSGQAPAHITVQIESNEEAIRRIKAKLALAPVPRRTEEATGPDAALMVMRARVEELADTFSDAIATTQHQMKETAAQTAAALKLSEERTAAALKASQEQMLTALGTVAKTNEEQTRAVNSLRTRQEYTAARVETQDGKLENLLYGQMDSERRRRPWQRVTLLMWALFILALALLVWKVFL
jgi:hypothetical protein